MLLQRTKEVARPVAAKAIDQRLADYITAARQAGAHNQLTEAITLDFLLEHRIPVFDGKAVASYMDWLAKRERMFWRWERLREHDQRYFPASEGRLSNGNSPVYSGRVPMHVLQLVHAIEAGLSERLRELEIAPSFYVTNIFRHQPEPYAGDPFLGFRTGGNLVIVACWDEPAFFAQNPEAVEV